MRNEERAFDAEVSKRSGNQNSNEAAELSRDTDMNEEEKFNRWTAGKKDLPIIDAKKNIPEDEVVRKYDLGKKTLADDEFDAEWAEREEAKRGFSDASDATAPEGGRVDDPEAAAMGGFDRSDSPRAGRTEDDRVDDPEAAAMGGFDRDAAGASSETSRVRSFEDAGPGAGRPYVFNREATGFFGRMSQVGRNVASRIYEGIYRMPIANRIMGRLEIAYNQIWLNRHEGKAVQFKDRMDGLDMSIGAMDQARTDMETNIAELGRLGMPGVESLRLELGRIDRSRRELLNRKDNIQSKFEKRDNKMKLYVNSRDVIANKLINYYDNKLRPMEGELANLQSNKDRLVAFTTGMGIRHRADLERAADIENRKVALADVLSRSGLSDRAIRRNEAIRLADDQIKQIHLAMQREKEMVANRSGEINKRIAKVDKKSNPRRDRRERFIRIKEGRPLDMPVATRAKGVSLEGAEEPQARTREFASEEPAVTTVGGAREGTETATENGERSRTDTLIADWNAYLTGEYGERMTTGENAAIIDLRNFLNETSLTASIQLSFEEFRQALEAYYKSVKNRNSGLADVVTRYFA